MQKLSEVVRFEQRCHKDIYKLKHPDATANSLK